LLAAGVWLCSVDAAAELLKLKNGNRIEGEVQYVTASEVAVDIPGMGVVTFTRDEVASIEPSAEKHYEAAVEREQALDRDAGAPRASAKKALTDDAAYRLNESADNARTLLRKAERTEPSEGANEEGAQKGLARALKLYEDAQSEAQEALELDRHYDAPDSDVREMKSLISDAREGIARVRRRMADYEQHAAAKARDEDEARTRERDGFTIPELGTTSSSY
jgi:hypothetical protein